MNIEQIVKKYLEDNGYDGLYNEDGECGCELNDLFPCDGFDGYCQPRYKVLGCPEICGQGCRFHIMAEKPKQGELPLSFEKEEKPKQGELPLSFEKEEEPEQYRCERCEKFFDKKMFSHGRVELTLEGQPIEVECGPILKVIR